MGLTPAPQKVQQEQIDGIFGRMPEGAKDLVNESISNTIKDGQDAEEILRTNAESQRLLDTGEMFTGIAADALVTFGQIGAYLVLMLRLPKLLNSSLYKDLVV